MTNPTILMTAGELDDLLEYSSTLPTGTKIGKQWKRKMCDGQWFLGEYTLDPLGDPKYIGIKWSPVKVIGRIIARYLCSASPHGPSGMSYAACVYAPGHYVMKLQKIYVVGVCVEDCEVYFDLQSAIDNAKETIKNFAFSRDAERLQKELEDFKVDGVTRNDDFICELDSGGDEPNIFMIRVIDVPPKQQ